MSKSEPFNTGNYTQEMLTSMFYTSLQLDDEPVVWLDATAVKEAVERLDEVHLDYLRPLDEIKEQLNINPSRHIEFLEFGGANALWDMLKTGNSAMQRKCMRAIEVLIRNDASRKHLREMGIGDTLLDIIRASARRPESARRAKAGELLKLLTGSSGHPVVFHASEKRQRRSTIRRFTAKRDLSPNSGYVHERQTARERPIPYWFFTTNPILPWDSETVSSLVDILLSTAAEEIHQDCAHRIIRKILYIGQFTRHVVLDPADISDLVAMICSMHSLSVYAVKAVTFASIMHTSNEVAFEERGGIDALVVALQSDNMGSICGEICAWALAYYCKKSAEIVKKLIQVGGIEALVELSYSSDKCSQEAAVHAVVALLKHSDKHKKTVLKKYGECDLIPSFLNILQEDYVTRNQAIKHEILWTLFQMARHASYRSEICDLDGIVIIQRSLADLDRPIVELGHRLQRMLTTRSQRLSVVWKSSNKKGKGFRSRIVHKLKKVFKTEKSPSEQLNETRHQGPSVTQSLSLPGERRRPIPERSISSLSSSIHSDCCAGLLATAPEGRTGVRIDDFFVDTGSPKFRTYSMQPYSETDGGYDKDFDPFAFGGRPLPLNKVEESNPAWSTGTSEKDVSGDSMDPEIITTHDFL